MSAVWMGFTLLVIAGCGGSQKPAKAPTSMTETTGVSMEGGPAAPGDPSGAVPEGSPKVTSGSVASPMEGGCERGEPRADASDLESCIDSCRGQNETVPLGSACLSQWESCVKQCRARTYGPASP
jgi:hypothetical protein